MDHRRAQHRPTLALSILALCLAGAAASACPSHGHGPKCLFDLSIEELMAVSIDFVCVNTPPDSDSQAVPSVELILMENPHPGRNAGISDEETYVSLTSLASDDPDYGRDQDRE